MKLSFLALPAVPAVLSVNAGYVDTIGFLALHGLFTSHVTGNFVTLGASLVNGTSGATAKVLALPVFCATVFSIRLLRYSVERVGLPVLGTLLVSQLVLLTLGAALAIHHGAFPDADAWPALITGMALVIAMAIQNGFHRIHFPNVPPSTIMTGTTTQAMLDLADLFHGVSPEAKAALKPRLTSMLASIAAFAIGCAVAALLYFHLKERAFVVPPVLGALTLVLHLFDKNKKPA